MMYVGHQYSHENEASMKRSLRISQHADSHLIIIEIEAQSSLATLWKSERCCASLERQP
jgi:hypothetical protein